MRTGNLSISENEIITVTLMADISGNSRIDYEEFMLYFHESLKMIRFH